MTKRTYRLHEVESAVIVKVDANGTGGEFANCLNAFGDKRKTAALIADVLEAHPTLLGAVMAIVEAANRYLPPDGISKDEFISSVLAATDNTDIVWALELFEPESEAA